MFSDSFDYLAQAQVAGLRTIRPPAYGLLLVPFLALPGGQSLWWVVGAQTLVSAWLIDVAVRALAPGRARTLLSGAVLAALTPLPWFVCWIMPDLMTGWLVLAAALLCSRAEVPRLELWLVLVVAIAVHATHVPLALGLAVGMALMWRAVRPLGVAALLLAALVATGANMAANRVITGQAVVSHGSSLFLGARLAELGLLQAELARRCPDPRLSLCARDLPIETDGFLWHPDSPVWVTGDFFALEAELAGLNRAAITAAPLVLLADAAPRALRQLFRVVAGDGLDAAGLRARQARLVEALPDAAASFMAARQWQDRLALPPLVAAQPVVALGALLVLVVLRLRPVPVVGAAVLLALLGNAALIGLFGAVHDRYQARIIWLVPLLALLAWPRPRRMRP